MVCMRVESGRIKFRLLGWGVTISPPDLHLACVLVSMCAMVCRSENNLYELILHPYPLPMWPYLSCKTSKF